MSPSLRIEVTLVDDGSTDGTARAIAESYPQAEIISGDGSLYWSGGMRLAMESALRASCDFILWLNDDTQLDPDAVERLVAASDRMARAESPLHVIVGSIRDPETGELSYGGSLRAGGLNRLRFRRVEPTADVQRCAVFNGNCVLLPRRAAERIGNLDSRLIHAAGDYEYGLRAEKKGVTCWIAPGYYGVCARNSEDGTWKDMRLSLTERYRRLFSVKGQPPLPRFVYYSRYGGPLWPLLYPLVYIRPLLDSVLRRPPRGARD